MVVIPKDKPVIIGMNSFYVNVGRLIEHFYGELESGGILFKSPSANGVVFFDDHIPLSGTFESKTAALRGSEAIQHLIDHASSANFTVSIYRIDSDIVHFWANLNAATALYTNLSTEFTDLKALIKKMSVEKLTGYIEVRIAHTDSSAYVFLNFGHILGGAYPWKDNDLRTETRLMKELLERAESEGGFFNVFQIELAAVLLPQPDTGGPPEPAVSAAAPDSETAEDAQRDIQLLEGFLTIFEETVTAAKRYRSQFSTLLRKKFITKAERYDFLDPFAADFEYSNGSITYTGTAPSAIVVKGVVESVWEMALEMGLTRPLIAALMRSNDTYKDIISMLDLDT